MARKPEYSPGVSVPKSMSPTPKMPDNIGDSIDLVDGCIEAFDGDGMQHSQHPAKDQAKVMRFIQ